MIARDVLKELYAGNISLEKCDEIYDSIISSDHAPQTKELLSLTKVEWTAFVLGADFASIAQWRYKGWPQKCAICNRSINAPSFGWLIVDDGKILHLKHVCCSPH